jgi:hypothetical protein
MAKRHDSIHSFVCAFQESFAFLSLHCKAKIDSDAASMEGLCEQPLKESSRHSHSPFLSGVPR